MQGKLSSPVVEEMILLSRLIKSLVTYPTDTVKKVISIKKFQSAYEPESEQTEATPTPIEILEEAKQEAEQIILEARIEQEKVITSIQHERIAWEHEKIELINEAKEEGYQAGWKEGERQGFDQFTSQIHEAKTVVDAAKKEYHAYLEASEKTILDLSLSIASKVVAAKIEDDRSTFFHLLKKPLKK